MITRYLEVTPGTGRARGITRLSQTVAEFSAKLLPETEVQSLVVGNVPSSCEGIVPRLSWMGNRAEDHEQRDKSLPGALK